MNVVSIEDAVGCVVSFEERVVIKLATGNGRDVTFGCGIVIVVIVVAVGVVMANIFGSGIAVGIVGSGMLLLEPDSISLADRVGISFSSMDRFGVTLLNMC